MMQAYQDAEQYIDGIPKFVKKNGLVETKLFYKKLLSPSADAKVIHVAGTNGKGSVCAYLQSVLMEAGYRVGMFTSPHLVDMRERIRVDNELINEADFVEAFRAVLKKIEEVRQEKDDTFPENYHPSYFEFLYFMAMYYFAKKQPDFILLETGLGGRLDATNSFETPCICIITEIGLDHTAYLGGTIEEIAWEKAGIVKKGIPLVYFAKNKIVADVMEKSAKKAETMAFSVKPEEICLKNYDEKGIDFSYYSGYYKDRSYRLFGTALYQQENAALCIKALAVLGQAGLVKISEQALHTGLTRMRWPGRMEEILPGICVDGAHNIDGIAAFLESVRAEQTKEGRLLLYSALAEKACAAMARKIVDAGLFEKIVITKIENSRAAVPEELASYFGKENVIIIEETKAAFAYCLRESRAGKKVYVAGSLYLIGQIRRLAEGSKEHDQL